MAKKKIGLVGYFGWGNFGDELFIEAHKQHLSEDFDLEVVNDLLKEPYISMQMEEVVAKYDGFLIGGGDLINPLRSSPLYWKTEYLQKPTFIIGLGVPSLNKKNPKVMEFYKEYLSNDNMKLIIARDTESCNFINKHLHPKNIAQFFPDPVCSLKRPEAKQLEEKTFGCVIRSHRSLSEDLSAYRKLIDTAKEKGYKIRHIVLGNMTLGKDDYVQTKKVAKKGEEIIYTESLDEQMIAIAECHMLASIKFHGLLVAAMYGIPTIALSTTPKNRNFLRMLDRMDMFGGYQREDVYTRVTDHPARIHQLVRSSLRRRSTEGYNLLKETMKKELGT